MRVSVRRYEVTALVAVVVALFLTVGAAQALLVKMSPQKMTRLSQRVVIADVWSVTPRHIKPVDSSGWGTIVTVVKLRVSDRLKGTSPQWTTLRIQGGSADGRTLVVEDTPQFFPGERVMLFLDAHGVVGWRQGALEVVGGQVEAWHMSLGAAKRRVTGRSAAPVGSIQTQSPPTLSASSSPAPSHGSPASIRLGAAQTLLSDGFEGTMGSWSLSGTPSWGQTTYRNNGGSKSAYCAQSTIAAPGPYANGMGNWMVSGPYNLADATAASFAFDKWYALGAGDSLYYGFSTDGSSFSLGGWTATSNGSWTHTAQDLSNWFGTNYLGQPAVWVAFRFASDASGQSEGAYVDNVALTKTTLSASDPAITGISPGSASAGTGSNVTITGTNFGASQGTGGVTFYYNSTDRITAPIVSWSDTSIVCTVPTGTVKGYAASAGSGPVIVTNNAGAVSAGYAFTVTFGYGGVKWASPNTTYTINANCVDTANETALVDAAWPVWNPASLFTLSRSGTNSTTSLPVASNSSRDIFWSQTTLGTGVLAVNQYWVAGSTIVDSDIAFNDADFTWGDGTVGGTFDIQSVALHELGHTIDLRDLYGPGDSGEVMYGMTAAATQKRSLSADDTAGVVWVYGARPAMSGALSVNAGAAWTRSLSVTLGSSIANATQMRFNNDGGAWSGWQAFGGSSAWSLVGSNGPRTVNAQYMDAGGNIYATADTIGFDDVAPITTDNDDAFAHRVFTVVLTPTDVTSGVTATEYRLDGGPWQAGTSVTLRTRIRHKSPGMTPGDHVVQYRSTDAAGNIETIRSCTVTLP